MTTETWQSPPLGYFEKSPRAKELKTTCLSALDILEKILKIKNRTPFMPHLYRDNLLNLYAQLERINGTLLGLNITDKTHSSQSPDTPHPDIESRQIANQLIKHLGPTVDNMETDDLRETINSFRIRLGAGIPSKRVKPVMN